MSTYIKLIDAVTRVNYSYSWLYTQYRTKAIPADKWRIHNNHLEVELEALLAHCTKKPKGKFKLLVCWFREDTSRILWSTSDIKQDFKQRRIIISHSLIYRAKRCFPEYKTQEKRKELILAWFAAHPRARYMRLSTIQRKLELEGVYISHPSIRAYMNEYFI